MKKGPGGEDGIPRDAAGETYYDRVRNVNAQLEAMQLDFLKAAAEHEAEERIAADHRPPFDQDAADPTMPPKANTVEQVVQVDREGYDHLLDMWIRYTSTGDQMALYHLFTDLVNPVLRALAEKAAKEGWFNET